MILTIKTTMTGFQGACEINSHPLFSPVIEDSNAYLDALRSRYRQDPQAFEAIVQSGEIAIAYDCTGKKLCPKFVVQEVLANLAASMNYQVVYAGEFNADGTPYAPVIADKKKKERMPIGQPEVSIHDFHDFPDSPQSYARFGDSVQHAIRAIASAHFYLDEWRDKMLDAQYLVHNEQLFTVTFSGTTYTVEENENHFRIRGSGRYGDWETVKKSDCK